MAVIDARNPVQLDRLAETCEANEWPGIFEPIMPVVREGIEHNFATRSGPSKGGITNWFPRKDTKMHPLLILSGTMLAAAAWNGAGAVREVTGRMLRWGILRSIVPYARAQQFGRKEINLPPRPFLGLADQFVVRINHLLRKGILERMREVMR